jgi:hypothetical protein
MGELLVRISELRAQIEETNAEMRSSGVAQQSVAAMLRAELDAKTNEIDAMKVRLTQYQQKRINDGKLVSGLKKKAGALARANASRRAAKDRREASLKVAKANGGGGGGGGGDDEKAQLGVYDGRLVEVLPRRLDDNRDELRVCISGEDLRDVGDEIVVKTIDVSFDNETVEDGLEKISKQRAHHIVSTE